MVSSAGPLRVAGREGEHASRATTLSSLRRTPSRRCCERRSTQDSAALHETAKLRVVQLISDVICFARTATTWRRMAHWWFRLRPSGGTIKPRTFLYLSFFGKIDLRCKGYAAFVEVGVVRLLFKILKQRVAFMRNCQRPALLLPNHLGLGAPRRGSMQGRLSPLATDLARAGASRRWT